MLEKEYLSLLKNILLQARSAEYDKLERGCIVEELILITEKNAYNFLSLISNSFTSDYYQELLVNYAGMSEAMAELVIGNWLPLPKHRVCQTLARRIRKDLGVGSRKSTLNKVYLCDSIKKYKTKNKEE